MEAFSERNVNLNMHNPTTPALRVGSQWRNGDCITRESCMGESESLFQRSHCKLADRLQVVAG